MRLAAAARLFAWNALWRATGLQRAGRALIDDLGSSDDDLRTVAGMFLARAGEKARPLLAEALARREHLPMVLTLLGDLGDHSFEPQLSELSLDPEPQVAEAARAALRVLRAQRQPGTSAH